jgi:hypothetical protein
LKNKTTWREWLTLLTFGLGALLVYHAVIIVVALIIGLLVDAFSDFEWHIAALVSYFGIRLLLEGLDEFSGFTTTKCPTCRKKIKTSRPIKCEECGGAAQLVRK